MPARAPALPVRFHAAVEDWFAATFAAPTLAQEKGWPKIQAGKHTLVFAPTGSGKTLAFLLPIIQRLAGRGKTRALVLAPTRELAIQIEANAKAYGRPSGLRTVAVVGGESLSRQINALRAGVDILVATPGRLLDLLNQRRLSLADIKYFVLDEADRMLDMGFIHDVKRIISKLPAQRQTRLRQCRHTLQTR